MVNKLINEHNYYDYQIKKHHFIIQASSCEVAQYFMCPKVQQNYV